MIDRTLVLTKHHGLGNDFLCTIVQRPGDVERGDGLAEDTGGGLAKQLCDRRRGVGADGLILVAVHSRTDAVIDGLVGAVAEASMALFNADGSRAEMSGNGIRCLAQAVAMDIGAEHVDLTVHTDAGVRRTIVRPAPAGTAHTVDVRVGMGAVRPGPSWRPSPASSALLAQLAPTARWATGDIGNPHLVVEVSDPFGIDVGTVGPVFEADFPAGVNVHFIAAARGDDSVAARDRIDLAVWERGAGVTEACGTGAAAAATIAQRWGLVGANVVVNMPGGTVDVVIGDEATELIGPATYIARVEVPLG